MNTFNMKESIEHLKKLKEENATSQKKGLPFMMASVLIWTLILIIRLLDMKTGAMNLATFCCSVLLLPLAFAFSKMLKADVFKKMENPIAKLGILVGPSAILVCVRRGMGLVDPADGGAATKERKSPMNAKHSPLPAGNAHDIRNGIRSTPFTVRLAVRQQSLYGCFDSRDDRRNDHQPVLRRSCDDRIHDRNADRFEYRSLYRCEKGY